MNVGTLIEALKKLPQDMEVGRLQLLSSHQRGSTQPRFYSLKGIEVKTSLFVRHDLTIPLPQPILEFAFEHKSTVVADPSTVIDLMMRLQQSLKGQEEDEDDSNG